MTIIIIIGLTLLSALFSGLTLGLMGLNKQEVQRKMKLGNKNAEKVWAVRKDGNRLLTTLLLSNVAVNSVLSIYLGTIASGFVAGLAATGILFLFGEVIPQAVISRHALAFGAKTAWFVKILMLVEYPINKPIALALDKMLGEELPTIYSKQEFVEVVSEHEKSLESEIDAMDMKIIHGALTFSDKNVQQVMTPKSVTTMFNIEQTFEEVAQRILSTGHTRFPIYDNNYDHIVGILLVKKLIGIDPGKKIKDIQLLKPRFVKPGEKLDAVKSLFLETRQHMFIVEENSIVKGIITFEDIIEDIIDCEIVDETDQHIDMQKVS